MSRKSKTDQRRKGGGDDEEVDMLLRAAEDEMLLNLKVDSHMSRGASQSSYIDPDLDRRFQALRSSRPTNKAAQPPRKPQPPLARTTAADDDDEKANDKKRVVDSSSISDDDDDLFARFAALKNSLPTSSSPFHTHDPQILKKSNSGDEQSNGWTIASDEDEVQKVIQWAIDAARLDPSPPTDDDDDDDDNADSISDGDSDDDGDDRQRNGERKKVQQRK